MNYVANQLIFKIVISVQTSSISILKFKDFLKNIFKQGFVHSLKINGHTCIIQLRKTAVSSLLKARGPSPPRRKVYKSLQFPLAKSFRKYKPKKQAFKRVLNLIYVLIRRFKGLGNLTLLITSKFLQFTVIIHIASKTRKM